MIRELLMLLRMSFDIFFSKADLYYLISAFAISLGIGILSFFLVKASIRLINLKYKQRFVDYLFNLLFSTFLAICCFTIFVLPYYNQVQNNIFKKVWSTQLSKSQTWHQKTADQAKGLPEKAKLIRYTQEAFHKLKEIAPISYYYLKEINIQNANIDTLIQKLNEHRDLYAINNYQPTDGITILDHLLDTKTNQVQSSNLGFLLTLFILLFIALLLTLIPLWYRAYADIKI